MKRTLMIALVALAAAAATSFAYAAVPSANGVISACKTADGAIKLIDREAGEKCPGSHLLVEWNEQGPVGPQGPAGPQGLVGPQGPTGATGPSDAYTKSIPNVVLPAHPQYPTSDSFQAIASLSLPAGKYIVFAKAWAYGGVGSEVGCFVHRGQVWQSFDYSVVEADPRGTISLVGPAVFPEDGVATLSCASSAGANLAWIRLTAIKVGQLTSS